jgi:hypothetical protein
MYDRALKMRSKYGLTLEQYAVLLEGQDGLCAICHRKEWALHLGKVKPLAVDHCHETGKIRGLLCSACNTAIGKFEDRIDILVSAQKYLEKQACCGG